MRRATNLIPGEEKKDCYLAYFEKIQPILQNVINTFNIVNEDKDTIMNLITRKTLKYAIMPMSYGMGEKGMLIHIKKTFSESGKKFSFNRNIYNKIIKAISESIIKGVKSFSPDTDKLQNFLVFFFEVIDKIMRLKHKKIK